MSNHEIKLKAEERVGTGSGPARRLRRGGTLPGVLSRIGGGTTAIQLDEHEFEQTMRREAATNPLVTLDLGGSPVTTLLREVQHDVMTGKAIHADFSEVSLAERLRVTIGIRLVGEPEGVRVGGGVLEQTLREVTVECLPTDIVESFDVDVNHLAVGQSLFVRDLAPGDKYVITTRGDIAVATVAQPDAEEEEGAEGAEGAEGESNEPEVIAKGKKEEADADDKK
ncbi:MAG: 50S ribosomal protein L25 [Kiritimatiellia bacterium]|jgi:large subunit ribosomal protein L25